MYLFDRKCENTFKEVLLFLVTSLKKKLYDPFLWMGFNGPKATDPLRGFIE